MHSKTWILIANGARARLVAAEKEGKFLHVKEVDAFDAGHQPSRELGDDAPGRVYESHGTTRHAIEPKHDPHRALKQHFAETIAARLDEHLAKRHFDKLVIAAPPVTLGDLRKSLKASVRQHVVAETAMDLTKTPNSELGAHVLDLVPL